ncbi:hypothetical protein ANAEL_00691 [Anaerolineales bacterium]|nr:hypothetical protein ANAEL_00691 [Anaerolineales bacterium]
MSNRKLTIVYIAVLLSLTMSLIFPAGVLADDTQPPAPDAPEVTTPPEETSPEEASAVETTVPDSSDEVPPLADETTPADSSTADVMPEETAADTESTAEDVPLLAQLPEGTEVVVLDESGNPISLATTEATEILTDPDPFLYVGGVKKIFTTTDCNPDVAGNQGCTTPIQRAIDYAKTHTLDDGTIYIEKGTFNETVTIADFTVALTLQGVLNASGAPIINPGDRPVINGRILLIDGSDNEPGQDHANTASITLADLIVNDTTGGSGDNPAIFADWNTGDLIFKNLDLNAASSGNSGLIVSNHSGNVTLINVEANGTDNRGASIDNTAGNSSVGVAVTDSVFNDNNSDGLYIRSDGAIALTNVTAGNANGTGNGSDGADLDNTTGNSSVGVTVTGGTFNDNNNDGLHIRSDGAITLTNVTAGGGSNTGNGGNGADVNSASGTGAVTVTGSVFNQNGDDGLLAVTSTNGSITISDTTFQASTGSGNLSNHNGAALNSRTVTLTNVTATNNDLNGISISNATTVNLNNVVATNNGTTFTIFGFPIHFGSGVLVDGNGVAATVNVTGGTFSNNQRYGLEIGNAGTSDTIHVYSFPVCADNVLGCYSQSIIDHTDHTPPVVTPTVSGTLGSNGWYTGNVTVTWSVSDPESTITSPACTNQEVTDDTVGVVFTCTATSAGGTTTVQTVTIKRDATPPTIDFHADEVAEATGPGGAVVNYVSPDASDNLSGTDPTASCASSSGSNFGLGDTTVTCTATDAAGNVTTSSFTVAVQDTTPPTINTPADIIVNTSNASGAIVNYSAPTTSDIVDGDGIADCQPPSGGTFPVGDTTVTCHAFDQGENSTETTFVIHVIKSNEGNGGGEQGSNEFLTNNQIIPVTGGGIVLSCTEPFTTVENMAGFEVTFTSLCGYSATLTGGTENRVSDLPAGDKYIGGINIALLKDGSPVEKLPTGSTIKLSLEIPSGMTGETLAILFWDPTTNTWVEKSLTVVDGKATIAIDMPGAFVLVEK